jgi:hypothetical protein
MIGKHWIIQSLYSRHLAIMGALDTGSPAQPWGVANGSPCCIWVTDILPAESVINLLTAAREKLLTIVAFEAPVR